MVFKMEDGSLALIGRNENETLRIEPWGHDALRVRATLYPRFSGNDWALSRVEPDPEAVRAEILPGKAVVQNGKIRAEVTNFGKINFYRRGAQQNSRAKQNSGAQQDGDAKQNSGAQQNSGVQQNRSAPQNSDAQKNSGVKQNSDAQQNRSAPQNSGVQQNSDAQQPAAEWVPVLSEYYRTFGGDNPHTPSMKLVAREFVPIHAGDYELNMRFESRDDEKIFGMGQYQQPYLDLKGCVLEMAQRNSQISIPFALSSLGYGFLWNNAGVGQAAFGKNYTEWHSESTEELDYVIIAGDTPKDIIRNYTEMVGRAPVIPENVLGLWQSKLRYRTQEELLEVAREYHRRDIPLDVIVVDFFHWIRQGDWAFDPEYWPDPQAMADELHRMGTRLMVSVWPTVDRQSVHFEEMRERGLLIRTERGSRQNFDFLGDTVIYDATNPEAREYIWEKCRENYYDKGVDMFWLDEAEPEFAAYTFDHFRYYEGPDVKVGNAYPMYHAKAFYDGQTQAGQNDAVNLLRSAWVGSQKYAAVVWSGDIYGNFAALRDQLAAGLNIGLAGIPWWTTDTGGFFADVTEPGYSELLVRWFEFSTFSPILRLHGDRGPHDIPPLAEDTMVGGGFCSTGRPNELWSYGEDVFEILKKYVDIRLEMKDYLMSVMEEAHENGSPVIRTMFYEFPEDPVCWNLTEQYMFGASYLVAPVLYEGQREKEVYFPAGKWESIHDQGIFCGPQTCAVKAPLDVIPVFRRM